VLLRQSLASLGRVRERILSNMNRNAHALALTLQRDHGTLDFWVNAAPLADAPAGLSHRLTVHSRPAARDNSLLLLSHTFLDQTSRQYGNGQPFGWTVSIQQHMMTADLTLLAKREFAASYAGALSDEPLAIKLSEASGEFLEALENGRFALGGDFVRSIARRHFLERNAAKTRPENRDRSR
jgi:hypothetical protein